MIRTITTSIIAIGFAGTAFAGTTFNAKLETPMTKAEKVVAAKVLWNCSDDTCVAKLKRNTVNVRTCKKVVKEVGKVAEFSNDNGALNETELAECNTAAKS